MILSNFTFLMMSSFTLKVISIILRMLFDWGFTP